MTKQTKRLIEKLFSLADIFDKVVSLQDEIPQRVKTIERVLADERNEPTIFSKPQQSTPQDF